MKYICRLIWPICAVVLNILDWMIFWAFFPSIIYLSHCVWHLKLTPKKEVLINYPIDGPNGKRVYEYGFKEVIKNIFSPLFQNRGRKLSSGSNKGVSVGEIVNLTGNRYKVLKSETPIPCLACDMKNEHCTFIINYCDCKSRNNENIRFKQFIK